MTIPKIEQQMRHHLDAYNQHVEYSREYINRDDKLEAIAVSRYHLHRYAELQRQLNQLRDKGEY